MKKFLTKISFCCIILLSAFCFNYMNTVDLSAQESQLNLTELQQPNDKLIGSVKTVTLVFYKVFDLLSNRGEA